MSRTVTIAFIVSLVVLGIPMLLLLMSNPILSIVPLICGAIILFTRRSDNAAMGLRVGLGIMGLYVVLILIYAPWIALMALIGFLQVVVLVGLILGLSKAITFFRSR